jgi:hypothetical protein
LGRAAFLLGLRTTADISATLHKRALYATR